ncbi:hypothetical protein JA1_001941 [Spathaspora sp. JA1]|nr:hypothetical protein JA1_001941 [Spathaspora sp. JA1]
MSSKFESKIPVPKSTHPVQVQQTKPYSPKDYQTTVLSIQERLVRKSSVYDPSTFSRPKQQGQPTRRSNNIQEKYYALNDECKNVSTEVDNLTRELADMKRKNKIFQYKVEETRDEVQLVRDRFQFTEESVVKKVADEERLMMLKSQESQMKLDNQFKEIEFEMKNQLEEAKRFDNQGLIDKIEELKQTERKLLEDVGKINQEKEELLKVEQETAEKDLEDKLTLLKRDQEKSSKGLQTTTRKRKKIQVKLNISIEKLKKQEDDLHKLKQEISDTEGSMSHFLTEKETLVSQLSSIETELNLVQAKDDKEQAEYDTIHATYVQAKTKMSKHDTHRRILENSIMDYEGKIRVYIIGDTEDPDVQLCGKKYQFNKQFPKSISLSNFTNEFSCLLKSSLRGSNVSIINTIPNVTGLVISIYNHISEQAKLNKNRQFTICYQSLSIVKSQVFDNINPNSQVDIQQLQSSKVQIKDQNQFSEIINRIQTQELAVHLISIGTDSSQRYETTVMVADCGNIHRDDQLKLFKAFKSITNIDSPISKILSFARYNSKCLFLGNVTSDEDFEYLNELQSINSMDSSYKSKM